MIDGDPWFVAKDSCIINESGLYSLVLRSRKPEAKAFKRSLLDNDIMYRMGDRYKVYSKYRDTYFEEKYDAHRGVTQIIVLDKGKQLLTKLYKEHKLIMKGQK